MDDKNVPYIAKIEAINIKSCKKLKRQPKPILPRMVATTIGKLW